MKVMTIVGARPQFIKAAVVSRAFQERRADVQEVIVHTGQHYDKNMSEVFFEEMNIPLPDYNLGVGGGTHGQNTGRMLEKLEGVMIEEKPDWVLVYGDTDSTLAGALAASKLHIRVAHVEAGLRSFNRTMPEEVNRVVTDHIADLLFVPTDRGRLNLVSEGVPDDKIKLVGDVMYDASLYYKGRSRKPSFPGGLELDKDGFVLCTIHRAANTDSAERLKSIFEALGNCGEQILLPLHPRTKAKLEDFGLTLANNVCVIEPVSYLEMVWLEANCKFVATDSGGVQKEAYFFQKLCKTLRDETEWVELVESGWNTLVGANARRIEESFSATLPPAYIDSLYGNGDAGQRIVAMISS